MNLNPNAVVLWAVLSLGGYLFFHTTRAALIGLFIGLCVSLVSTALNRLRD